MPAPTRVGTASAVNASADSGSTAVEVPAGCNLVIAMWSAGAWSDGAGAYVIESLTLGGESLLPVQVEASAPGGGSFRPGTGVAYRVNPLTGTRTLAWAWSSTSARYPGGELVLVYVQDADTTNPIRDADAAHFNSSDPASLTLDTETTDLLLAMVGSGSNPTLDGTVFATGGFNDHFYDVSEVTPQATSTTINTTGENNTSMAAVALREAAPPASPPIFHRPAPLLDGVAVDIGDGTPRLRQLAFSGIATPFWVRLDAAQVHKITEDPFVLTAVCGSLEITSSYPYAITGASFAFGTHRRLAQGSDNWPLTWAANGHLYTTWGDGAGFGIDVNTSLGIARIEGSDPATATGVNINGGQNPESANTTWPNATGPGSGKSYGIIALGSLLYMWAGPGQGDESFQHAQLWKSTDAGYTWAEVSGVRINGTDSPALNLVMPTIVQSGQDNEFGDGHIYSLFIGLKDSTGLDLQTPGELYLCRVLEADIETMAEYEWFTGTPAIPSWGVVANRVPAFELAPGIGWCTSGCTWIPAIGLYVLCVSTEAAGSGLKMYWSRKPWGPWTEFFSDSSWGVGTLDPQNLFAWYVSPKWQGSLVAGEVDFIIVTSGAGGNLNNDSYNSVQGTFTVA